MSFRALMVAAGCTVVASGCGAPTAVLVPASSPPSEALAYFPEDAMAVATVSTDPSDPGVGRLLSAVAAAAPDAVAAGPDFEQVRPLLGHDLAVGTVAPGRAALAVLVARDGMMLGALAEARADAGLAAPAGRYRGADLYAAGSHAFGVRADVLLVSATTADLRDALDRRAEEDGMEASDLPRGDAHVRAAVRLPPLLSRAEPWARSVPWIAAATRLELTVEARRDAAVASAALATTGDVLLEPDVPIPGGGRGVRMVDVVEPRVAVGDLGHVLEAAERAAATAVPLALVRAAPVLPGARRLASGLHGPATVVRDEGRLLLRAEPSEAGRVERGLEQIVRSLPRAGFDVRRAGSLSAAGGVRFGMVDGALVASLGGQRGLRRLARAPLARPAGARGSLAFALPGRGATGWVAARPRRAYAEVRIDWP